jgi:hypothetical protein
MHQSVSVHFSFARIFHVSKKPVEEELSNIMASSIVAVDCYECFFVAFFQGNSVSFSFISSGLFMLQCLAIVFSLVTSVITVVSLSPFFLCSNAKLNMSEWG